MHATCFHILESDGLGLRNVNQQKKSKSETKLIKCIFKEWTFYSEKLT